MSTPGAAELLIVLVIVLLILGPKRLPSLGRQLGGGIREFRKSFGGGSGASDEAPELVRDGAARPDAASPTSSAAAAPQASAAPRETRTASSPVAPTVGADAGETEAGEAHSERRSV